MFSKPHLMIFRAQKRTTLFAGLLRNYEKSYSIRLKTWKTAQSFACITACQQAESIGTVLENCQS